jgi:hypothetical protein
MARKDVHQLPAALGALSDELGRWAQAARRIEDGLTGGRPSPAALQEIDALRQHLEQLQRYVAGLSDAAEGTVCVAAATQVLNLDALAQRLRGEAVAAARPGDCELW